MFAMPVPIAMRDVRPAMPATVVRASLLNTPSTIRALSNPRSSARTASSTASRTPTANPQMVTPIFMRPRLRVGSCHIVRAVRRLGSPARAGSAEQLPGEISGRLPALDRHLPIHDDGRDALGLLHEAARA